MVFKLEIRFPCNQVPSDATIITREFSGSFTSGSSGRTNPFSTTPATAMGDVDLKISQSEKIEHPLASQVQAASVQPQFARLARGGPQYARQLKVYPYSSLSIRGDNKDRNFA